MTSRPSGVKQTSTLYIFFLCTVNSLILLKLLTPNKKMLKLALFPSLVVLVCGQSSSLPQSSVLPYFSSSRPNYSVQPSNSIAPYGGPLYSQTPSWTPPASSSPSISHVPSWVPSANAATSWRPSQSTVSVRRTTLESMQANLDVDPDFRESHTKR